MKELFWHEYFRLCRHIPRKFIECLFFGEYNIWTLEKENTWFATSCIFLVFYLEPEKGEILFGLLFYQVSILIKSRKVLACRVYKHNFLKRYIHHGIFVTSIYIWLGFWGDGGMLGFWVFFKPTLFTRQINNQTQTWLHSNCFFHFFLQSLWFYKQIMYKSP